MSISEYIYDTYTHHFIVIVTYTHDKYSLILTLRLIIV